MLGESLNVLMVEDDIDFVHLIRWLLADVERGQITLANTSTLAETRDHIATDSFDAILLDLFLPDSNGLDTFTHVRILAPNIPIVVLSAHNDFRLALQAVREGAQDYLIKGDMSGPLLSRALRYAIERHNLLDTLRHLSLLDELTSLYNRRGFLELARQHHMLAKRTDRNLALIFADLDGLKKINDQFGHLAGDKALVNTANVLRKTFRRSDIVARLGGDEFAVLAIDATPEHAQVLLDRFKKNLDEINTQNNTGYKLSISLGTVYLDTSSKLTLEEWLDLADRDLYDKKRSREPSRITSHLSTQN